MMIRSKLARPASPARRGKRNADRALVLRRSRAAVACPWGAPAPIRIGADIAFTPSRWVVEMQIIPRSGRAVDYLEVIDGAQSPG